MRNKQKDQVLSPGFFVLSGSPCLPAGRSPDLFVLYARFSPPAEALAKAGHLVFVYSDLTEFFVDATMCSQVLFMHISDKLI